MGSRFTSLASCPWSEVPAELKTHVMGLDISGEDMFQEAAATRPSLLVVGSESHGMNLKPESPAIDWRPFPELDEPNL